MNEINFRTIIKGILKKFYIVIIFSVIGFLVGYFYNNSKLDYTFYDVNASLYLKTVAKDESESLIIDEKKVQTYAELLKSKIVVDRVISNLNLDMDYTSVKNNLLVTVVPNTSIINILYTGTDNETTVKFVKELCKTFTEDDLGLDIKDLQVINDGNVVIRNISEKNNRYIISMTAIGIVIGITAAYSVNLYYRKRKNRRDNNG